MNSCSSHQSLGDSVTVPCCATLCQSIAFVLVLALSGALKLPSLDESVELDRTVERAPVVLLARVDKYVDVKSGAIMCHHFKIFQAF